jgi:integrase/recombinase XerD
MRDNPNKNLFKRGKVWWLEVTIKDKKIRESLGTDEVSAARKLRDKRVDELQVTGGERYAWDDVVKNWFSGFVKKKSKSQETAVRYYVSLKQVQPFLSKYNIDKIDGRIILKMIEVRKAKGVSEATIRRDLTAVSAVLKYAEDHNLREGNPAIAKRRLLDESRDPIVLPTQSEIDDVLACCPPRFAALVKAARHTGCRQAELTLATWDGFNAQRRTLTVIGKGTKRRTVSLNDAAFKLICNQPRVEGSDYIFCREDGVVFTQAASDFTHFRRSANVGRKKIIRFRFHDLRHLYAVESLHSGMSLYVLQKQLGHTTIRVTEMYLEHLSPEEQEHARRGTILGAIGANGAAGTENFTQCVMPHNS